MTLQRRIDQLITHRASEWVETLKTGGPEERAAFVDWLRESRKHVSEFLTLAVLDGELNATVFEGLVDRKALLRRVSPAVSGLGGETRPSPLAPSSRIRRGLRYWRRPMWLAAGVAILAVLLNWAGGKGNASQEFTTGNTKQRAIELADGSVVLLNSASKVEARLSSTSRDLKLVQGEALFKVARDGRRPFRVSAGETVVQAVGTQFNVASRDTGTVVSVLEGKVMVSTRHPGLDTAVPTALGSGEEAVVDARGRIALPEHAVAVDAGSWQPRRLVFKQAALGEVVREFNRHNAAPKLRLEGVDPDSLHYSAIFHADDPGSFADFLSRERDVTVERRGEEIVIKGR